MEEKQLSPELQRLERLLADRPMPDTPAALRGRVLGGIRVELCRNRLHDRWKFTAAMAATVVLWINLSLSATQATDYGLQLGSPQPLGRAVAEEIQEVLPELPPREVLRQSMLLQAGSKLAWSTDLPVHAALRERLGAAGDSLPEGE